MASSLTLLGLQGYHCIDTAQSRGFASAEVRKVRRKAAATAYWFQITLPLLAFVTDPRDQHNVTAHTESPAAIRVVVFLMHTLHKQALAFESEPPKWPNVSETIPTEKNS